MDDHKPLLNYSTRDAVEVSQNPYQGDYKKVLCVCSAGILRSATTAVILSQEPYNYNTRSAGIGYYALIPVTMPLLAWADEIICMTKEHYDVIQNLLKSYDNDFFTKKKVICLNIPDSYEYRNEELINMIKTTYDNYLKE